MLDKFVFPKNVWLSFRKSADVDCYQAPYWSCVLKSSDDVKAVMEQAINNDYGYVEVTYTNGCAGVTDVYKGDLNVDKVLESLWNAFDGLKDSGLCFFKGDSYLVTDDFKNRVLRYFEAVKVLVDGNSDMESIIHMRDINYGEQDAVQACIDAIMSIHG